MRVDAYRLKGTADVLLRQLEAADRSDHEAERKAKRFGRMGALFLVLGVISLPFSAGVQELFFLTAILVVAGIVSLVIRAKATKFDLDDRKLDAALGLLKVLRTDISANEVIELGVDFRDYRAGGRLINKDGGWLSSLKVYDYEHDWFHITARLADGNVVSMSVTDEISRKEKSKRKYTKVRERTSSDVSLSIKLREGDAPSIRARLSGAPPGLAIKRLVGEGPHFRASFVGGQTLSTSGRGSSTQGEPLGGDALLGALLWVYGGIAPAKTS
jgi:hypothetical protein